MKVLYTLLIILFQIQYSFCQILISDNKSFIDAEIFRFEDVKKELIGEDSLLVFKKNNIPVTGVVIDQFSKKLNKHIHHSYYENGKFIECYGIDEKGKFSHRRQNDKYYEGFGDGYYGVRDIKDGIIHRLGKEYHNDKSTDSKDVSIYVYDNNDEILFEMTFCWEEDTNYLCDVLYYKNNKNIIKKRYFDFPYEKDTSFSKSYFDYYFEKYENGLISNFSLIIEELNDYSYMNFYFYENGRLKEYNIIVNYIDDFYEFYENGKIKSMSNNKDDKGWYLNGQLEYDYNSDPVYRWHENGKKETERMPNGEYQHFDENGNLEYIFKDGKIIKDYRE